MQTDSKNGTLIVNYSEKMVENAIRMFGESSPSAKIGYLIEKANGARTEVQIKKAATDVSTVTVGCTPC